MARSVRVSVWSILSLLIQLVLNYAAYREIRKVLAGAEWQDLHQLAALGALALAIMLGVAGLRSMLLAAAASRVFKVAFGVICAGIALVAGGLTILFLLLVLSMIPGGFRVRGLVFGSLSLAAGITSLLELGGGVVIFGAYAGVAGMLAQLLLFRSEADFYRHSLVRTILTPSEDPWDEEEPIPGLSKYAPPPRPAPPPPPRTVPPACTLCPPSATSPENLSHTELLAASGKTPAPPDNHGESRYEVRRCRTCKTVWWADVREGWEPVDARALADDPTQSPKPLWGVRGTAFRSSLKDATERARQFVRVKAFEDRLVAIEKAERPPWVTL